MPNFDGLWELRLFYDTTPSGEDQMEHRFTIDVNIDGIAYAVGDPFTDFGVIRRNNADITLQTAADELENLLAAFYSTTTNFLRWELWYAPEATTDFTFYSTYAIGHVGDLVTGSVAAAQNTMTLRTQAGGIMRVQLMETSIMNNTKDGYPFASTPAQALANYLAGTTNPFLARDNSFPISPAYFSQTQNEKLYRKRYR